MINSSPSVAILMPRAVASSRMKAAERAAGFDCAEG